MLFLINIPTKLVHFISFVSDNATGTHSVYTTFEGHEIMFHVSTLLPYHPENKQQVCTRACVCVCVCVSVCVCACVHVCEFLLISLVF